MPPTLTILCGPAASGKTGRSVELYTAALSREPLGGAALAVLPNRALVDAFKRRVVARARPGALLAPGIMTFESLAQDILMRHRAAIRRIPPAGRFALVRRAIAESVDGGEIELYRNVAAMPGFARAAERFIGELKRAETAPERFEQAARRSASAHARELAAIYRRYQSLLVAEGLYDDQGIFWQAGDAAEAFGVAPFDAAREAVVDGFTDFSPSQIRLLTLLARNLDRLTITLTHEADARRGRLFEATRRTLDALRNAFGPEASVTVETLDPPQADGPLARIERGLFGLDARDAQSAKQTEAPPASPRDIVSIIETASPAHLVREALRRARAWIAGGLHAPGDIALIFRSVAPWRDDLLRWSGRFGLQLDMQSPLPFARTGLGRIAIELARIALDGYPTARLLRLMRSSYLETWIGKLLGNELTLERLGKLLREAGVARGRESIAAGLSRLDHQLAEEARSGDPESDESGPERHEAIACERRQIAQAQRVFEAVFDALDPIAARGADGPARLDAFESALDKIKFCADEAEARLLWRDLEAAPALQTVRGELRRALAALPVLQNECKSLDADAFAELVAEAVSRASCPAPRRVPGGVAVVTATEARGRFWPAVILVGLSEGQFPARHHENTFFGDDHREALRRQGVTLRRSTDDADDERALFYHAVTRATKRLALAWASADSAGRPALESPYLRAVRDLFDAAELPVKRVPAGDVFAPLTDTASETELRQGAVDALLRGGENAALHSALAALVRRQPDVYRTAFGAARVEEARWSSGLPEAHDGVIGDEAICAALGRRYGPAHRWSPTRLERFAGCGLAFFFGDILGLDDDEDDESYDARRQGSALHRALQRFFAERAAKGKARLTPADADTARKRMARLAEQTLRAYAPALDSHGPAIAAALRRETVRLCEAFVRGEIDLKQKEETPLTPSHFEFDFGLGGGAEPDGVQPLAIDDGARQALLRGRIDRIDTATVDDALLIDVVDYKRTAHSVQNAVQNGTHLQLPIYMMAARQMLFDGRATEPGAGILRDLRHPGDAKRVEMDGALLDQSRQFILDHIDAIHAGRFAPPPDSCADRYCPYKLICRCHEDRIARKTDAD